MYFHFYLPFVVYRLSSANTQAILFYLQIKEVNISVAKGKYQKWLEPEGLTLLTGWARDGLTDEQIAHNMGINKATLYDWIKKYPDISNSLKGGKEVVDIQVENALLKNALSGNITAQIFWLKNRRPDKWRDKVQEDNNATLEKLDDILQEIKNDAIHE